MAIYRSIQMSFWTDSKVVDDFTPEDRYFYLYLFTNPHTNLAGCYELSLKQASVETGYSTDSITNLLNRFERVHGVIQYSRSTKEVLILNWHRYNWTLSEKFRKPLKEEIDRVKDDNFREYLTRLYEGEDTVSIPYPYPMDTTVTVTVTDTVSVTDTNTVSVKPKEVKAEFEKLWELYPKKQGKQSAFKAYEKARKDGVTYEEVESGIKAYSIYVKGKDTQYIKMGSSFFNQRAWQDDWSVSNGHTRFDEYDDGTSENGNLPSGWENIFGS